MATATPSVSNATLPGTLSGVRFTLGMRIVLSYGALFALMLVMAAVSYMRLRAIDDEALSLTRDSVPGLFWSTELRTRSDACYDAVVRAIFVDGEAESTKRDIDRLPDLQRHFAQASAGYEATLFRDDDRERYRAFKTAYDHILPLR